MQSADKRKFLEIVNGMAAIKPGKPLTTAALELFWNAMQRWTIEEFQEAANHLMRTVEFMPNPYHFEQLRKASEATASEAWVEACTRSVNRRTIVYPQDRIARAVASVGGLERIAMADVERDLPHIQRRFLEAYEELTDVECVREALPAIASPQLSKKTANGFEQIGAPVGLAPPTAARLPHRKSQC